MSAASGCSSTALPLGSPRAFGSPLRLRGGSPSPRSPNFLLAFPCFHFGLPSELSNVQPFNMAMQDRYGLLTDPCSSKTLVITADLNSLLAFRLQLRDCDRWVVDRWIGLLRPFLNSPPGLPDPCRSAISSSPSAPSSPPATAPAASSHLIATSTSLRAVIFFSGPDSLADGPAPLISSDSFLYQPPFPQPLSFNPLPHGFFRCMRSRFYGDRALTEPPIIPVTTGNTSRNNVPNKTLLVGTFVCAVIGTMRSTFCVPNTVFRCS